MVMEGDCVWMPNLLNQFKSVLVFESEDDESPRRYRSFYDHPPQVTGRIIYIDEENGAVHVVMDEC